MKSANEIRETGSPRPSASGLDGVLAAETSLSEVDGEGGHLRVAGFDIEALAGQASFEEICCLLWSTAGRVASRKSRIAWLPPWRPKARSSAVARGGQCDTKFVRPGAMRGANCTRSSAIDSVPSVGSVTCAALPERVPIPVATPSSTSLLLGWA